MTTTQLRFAAAFAAAIPLLAACQPKQEASAYQGPYAKEVSAAIPAIEKSVGLKFKRLPKVESKSKDEVRAFLEKKFDEEQPALEFAGAERAYKLLGLLPDSLNLRSFMLGLLSEQVIGYYDPSTKVLYVVAGDGSAKGSPSADIVNVTITHELVHALQDQYVGLDSLAKVHGDNDRQTAAQAVIEGQATFEQLSVMLGGSNFAMNLPGGWDRVRQTIRESQGSMPVFSSAPMLVQETLLFPYLSGADFVRRAKEKLKPGELLYAHMPSSTEQVLHPEKLLDSLDAPIRITLPKPAGATVIYENDLGEFETRLFLYQHLNDIALAQRGAMGWGGDRYVAVNTPQGPGLTWLTLWDNAMQAAQFRDLMERVIEKRFGSAPGSGGAGEMRRFAGKGRTLELVSATVQGHPAVLFTDVPAGASTRLIDVAKVTLRTP
jgi:hypothetical protein